MNLWFLFIITIWYLQETYCEKVSTKRKILHYFPKMVGSEVIPVFAGQEFHSHRYATGKV